MYGPPQSDSEDDNYEGFYFGDDIIKKEASSRYHWEAHPDQKLYDAVVDGNLEELIKHISTARLNINEILNNGYTLLHYACKNGHLQIVEYLLANKANANKQIDSVTPLMQACDCIPENAKDVKAIVSLLIQHDAVINVSDKFGWTPLMFACKNGYVEVVRLLVKGVSLEACDNNGCTALFHAIENNKIEIVRLLVEAGCNVSVCNRKGYTPRQFAQFYGFHDILSLLPREEQKYIVPTTYICYNSIRDLIPRIFLKSEVPEYFQEVTSILTSLDMDRFLENFAKEKINLSEFLTMDNERLQKIGIKLPIHRNKIEKGLLKFHLNHWSKKSIAQVKRKEPDSFYDILLLSGNHLQNLIILQSTVTYVQNNLQTGRFGELNLRQLEQFRTDLRQYKRSLKDLRKTAKYLQSFSPSKSPLYIDYDEYVSENRRGRVQSYVKYTLFIGISIVICLKMNKII